MGIGSQLFFFVASLRLCLQRFGLQAVGAHSNSVMVQSLLSLWDWEQSRQRASSLSSADASNLPPSSDSAAAGLSSVITKLLDSSERLPERATDDIDYKALMLRLEELQKADASYTSRVQVWKSTCIRGWSRSHILCPFLFVCLLLLLRPSRPGKSWERPLP